MRSQIGRWVVIAALGSVAGGANGVIGALMGAPDLYVWGVSFVVGFLIGTGGARWRIRSARRAERR